ncbi:MAG: hypothetical protein ACPG1C_14685 [Alphaproteobacteria bacterium]
MIRLILCFALFVLPATALPASAAEELDILRAAAANNGRILFWRGRLKPARLHDHLAYLSQQKVPIISLEHLFGATVIPTPDQNSLPDRAAVLVFDLPLDQFEELVWPKLRKAKWPATLLIDPAMVEPNSATLQLARLQKSGISIGLKLPRKTTMAEAKQRVELFRRLAKRSPIVLLQGEGIRGYGTTTKGLGTLPVLTTDNGVVEPTTPRNAVPSFVVSHIHAESKRFAVIIDTLPLPVSGVTPDNRILATTSVNPPAFGFTIAVGLEDRLGDMTCRSTGNNKTSYERLGPYRIEVRLARRFSPGLHRIDCLVPVCSTCKRPRWRWFGVRFQVER